MIIVSPKQKGSRLNPVSLAKLIQDFPSRNVMGVVVKPVGGGTRQISLLPKAIGGSLGRSRNGVWKFIQILLDQVFHSHKPITTFLSYDYRLRMSILTLCLNSENIGTGQETTGIQLVNQFKRPTAASFRGSQQLAATH